MYRFVYLKIIIMVLFIGLTGCANEREESEEEVSVEEEKVVAIVNEDEILKSQLNQRVEQSKLGYEAQHLDTDDDFVQQIEEQILEDMIHQLLIIQAAEQAGLNEDIAEEKIAELQLQYEDENEFRQALEYHAITIEDLKRMIIVDLFVESQLENIELNEEEVDELLHEYNHFTEAEINMEQVRPVLEYDLRQRKRGEKLTQLLEQLRKESYVQIMN